MESFNENKKIENALIPSKEREYDPIKLQRLTLHYAELMDAQGKRWIADFGNDEWREQSEENAAVEDTAATVINSNKMEFFNKEDAFLYLKVTAFKKEMEENILISREHELDTNVYERVIEILNQAEKEPDEVKKKQLIVDAFKLHNEEA